MRRLSNCAPQVECLWRNPVAAEGYSSAVSLHSHTLHSRESLDFLPRVFEKIPPINALVQRASDRRKKRCGRAVDFERAFWRPPLHAQAAYELEARQIRTVLGLRPMVSLTDHDELEACAEVNALGIAAPFSVEWTAPFGAAVFHFGVHNLPADEARGWMAEMARYTAAPNESLLGRLLAAFDGMPEVLLVLNHPYCTEQRISRALQAEELTRFLAAHGSRMHALELNGLQPASDNRDVVRLARETGIPAISGGDRHCLEPNANVNLTNAGSFAEFVNEVRVRKLSRVLFLPQYREPLAARIIEFIWHAVKNHPDLPGRERYVDRIFYEHETKGVQPLSTIWPAGEPGALRALIAAIGFPANPGVRATLRRAIGAQEPTGA
jgi:hypothetical protein